jgi:hypothetical protein
MELTERSYVTDLHRHNHSDESFYVVSGELTLFLNGRISKLGPGSFVHIPRGTPHSQGNRSPNPVKLLMRTSPSGFEGFMRDRVELIKEAPRGSEEFRRRIQEIASRYDLETLGPSPIESGAP